MRQGILVLHNPLDFSLLSQESVPHLQRIAIMPIQVHHFGGAGEGAVLQGGQYAPEGDVF